ncbi:MAG: TetR/AcrR family transcriptional regulator [Congregibacter sp.]
MSKQLETAEEQHASKGITAVPMGRRERAKKEKLRRIMEAARYLFEAQGFDKTTTQQIADRADIGTGTLFLYTESKEDLLVMVFERDMQEQATRVFSKTSGAQPPVDQVCAVFREMMDYHAQDLEISEVLLRTLVMAPVDEHRQSVHAELMATIFDGLAQITLVAQKNGITPRQLDPGIAARSMFSCYYLGLVRWLTGQNTRAAFEERLRLQCAQILDPNGKSFDYEQAVRV